VIAGTSAPAYPHLHKQDGHRMNHHLPLPLPGVTGRRLRKTLAERPVTVVGAPFPLAAREIERQGFAAIYLSGAAFSAGLLGMPDIGLISQEHLCEQTARLAASVEIPVIVDADTGFGGPDSVAECVTRLEAAGAAAIQIEDQSDDKRCGHLPGKRVIAAEEMLEKITAACAARKSSETVIIARTDIRSVSTLEDCLDRLSAYQQAGADWLFPEALTSREEFLAVGRWLVDSKTIGIANMTEFGRGPLLTVDELGTAGFAAVLYPVTLLRLAMKAIEVGLELLTDEGSQLSLLDLMQTREELYDLLDYDPAHPEAWRQRLGIDPEE
jgi:methylisocitrate lyase